MISIAKEALRLTKKYAVGASCKIDFKNIESTMFYPYYVAIAQKLGLNEITLEVVKKYWLETHNEIILRLYEKEGIGIDDAKDCMIRLRKSGNKLFAIHGRKTVDVLTREEAEFLKKKIQEMPKSLQ